MTQEGCSDNPSMKTTTTPREPQTAAIATLPDTAATQLAKAIRPLAQAHPGKSGVVPLADGRDAFAARPLLADAAERTLDLQY